MEPTDSDQPRRRSPHPLIGRTLNGRYEILDVVGAGGMATVFRARDVRLGRDVAIKVLHPQFAADEAFVERFRQEAEFAAGLSAHPNIVSIFDVGEDGELSYIVMELVAGRNLKDLIAADGPIPVDRSFRIGQQIASALEFAHRRGLIHRDVKPQNILVSDDDSVKVTDFGIARSAASTQMTRTGMVMGSAHYLSPEQAQGQPADASSDIYALGIVLFEMLTGRVPFDADNPLGVAMKQVHEPPPPPNRINPAISPSAAAVVLRALNKDPADRYRSAAEFGLAMQQQELPDAGQTMVNRPVSREVVAAEPATTVVQRQGPPRTRRVTREVTPPPNPWRRTLLILGLIALVVLAALGSWFAFASAFGTKHTPTPTVSPTATSTPRPTATRHVVVHVDTPTPTATFAPPPPTNTPPPPPTNTPKPKPTNTPRPKPTNTPVPTNTPIPTDTPVPSTPTPVPTNTPIG